MSSLGPVVILLLWVCIGVAMGAGHLWMLWRALARIDTEDFRRARVRVAGSLPLRLLVVAPLLYLAVRTGFWACLGLVLGSLATRVWALYQVGRHDRLPLPWRRQG